jgi:hypothetical protein
MSSWNPNELRAIGDAEELEIASARRDGTMRPFVTIWHVAVAGQLYVRSAYGPENGWFRRAAASGTGRIRAGGIERDVAFDVAPGIDHRDLDDAYRRKYAHQPPQYVAPVVGDIAATATLRVSPL